VTLAQKQRLFVQLIGHLIDHAYERGWAFTFGDANRPDQAGHMKNSLHYIRLAIDLNLFVNDEYQANDCPEWQALGGLWEALHPLCRWGGRFGDENHFSLEHDGRK
jgi:hypothetical protein